MMRCGDDARADVVRRGLRTVVAASAPLFKRGEATDAVAANDRCVLMYRAKKGREKAMTTTMVGERAEIDAFMI